jgi:hypothetical protein
MTTPEEFSEILTRELAKCHRLKIDLPPEMAVSLIAVIQLAKRHPQAKWTKVMDTVTTFARYLQETLGESSPEIDRLLELGWHEVFDESNE